MTVALLLLVIAFVVYGLERNHSRMQKPRPRLHGSADTFRLY